LLLQEYEERTDKVRKLKEEFANASSGLQTLTSAVEKRKVRDINTVMLSRQSSSCDMAYTFRLLLLGQCSMVHALPSFADIGSHFTWSAWRQSQMLLSTIARTAQKASSCHDQVSLVKMTVVVTHACHVLQISWLPEVQPVVQTISHQFQRMLSDMDAMNRPPCIKLWRCLLLPSF